MPETGTHPCGPTGGPKNGFKMRNWCWKLTGVHRAKLGEATQRREAARVTSSEKEQQRGAQNDKRFRRSQLYKDIAETLDTADTATITAFRDAMREQHQLIEGQAREYNDAFDEVVDQFLGADASGRQNRGSFISKLSRARDPAQVKGFDLTVQYVRDHPELQSALLSGINAESVGAGDTEALVFEALKQGKRQVPSLNSEEVWDAMGEILHSFDALESTEKSEGELVPFSQGKPNMPKRFKKEVMRPGTYYPQGNRIDIPKDRIRDWAKSTRTLLNNGTSIPVPYTHNGDPEPILDRDPSENPKDNAGWLTDIDFDEATGALTVEIEPSTDADAENFGTKIKDLSIRAKNWGDGKGNDYRDVITHVAAVVHPVMTDQKPFIPTDGLACSMTMGQPSYSGTRTNSEVITIDSCLELLKQLGIDAGPNVGADNAIEAIYRAAKAVLNYQEMEEGQGYGTQAPEGSKVQQPAPIAMSQDELTFAMNLLKRSPTNPATGKAWTPDAVRLMHKMQAGDTASIANGKDLQFSNATKARQDVEKHLIAGELRSLVQGQRMRPDEAQAFVQLLTHNELTFSQTGQLNKEDPTFAGMFQRIHMLKAGNDGSALTGQTSQTIGNDLNSVVFGQQQPGAFGNGMPFQVNDQPDQFSGDSDMSEEQSIQAADAMMRTAGLLPPTNAQQPLVR